MKKCPFCLAELDNLALKCRHCWERVVDRSDNPFLKEEKKSEKEFISSGKTIMEKSEKFEVLDINSESDDDIDNDLYNVVVEQFDDIDLNGDDECGGSVNENFENSNINSEVVESLKHIKWKNGDKKSKRAFNNESSKSDLKIQYIFFIMLFIVVIIIFMNATWE